MADNCAPGKGDNISCFTKDQLIYIGKVLNKEKKRKIINVKKSKKDIWEQIKKELFSECIYEWCWLDQKEFKNIKKRNELMNAFKPKMPKSWGKNKYEWLTTVDIYKVMKQYEELYKNFIFFGPVPSDCPVEIYCELSNLNLEKLQKKKDYIGVVFNLDKHNEPGSHWVGLFVDIKKGYIFYYDSTAHPPPDSIFRFIKNIEDSLKKMKKKVVYKSNKHKHQFGGSECGIYSMNFIVEMLNGNKFEDIEKRKIPDNSMNVLRNYFFRPYNE